MKSNRLISILQMTVLATVFILLYACTRQGQCPLCEREIHAHMQVSITRDGKSMDTCCMACALTYQKQEKNVKIISATEFLTDAQVDPQKAVYVVDSDVSPCTKDWKVNKVIRDQHSAMYACYDRCEPSMLVFSNRRDAESFQKEHGGHIQNFEHLQNWLGTKRNSELVPRATVIRAPASSPAAGLEAGGALKSACVRGAAA